MVEPSENLVVLCVPGFPVSQDDSDKPFLLTHARSIASSGISVTVVAPACPGSPSRQEIDGIKIVRVRYALRRWETLAATGSMYREARGLKALLVPFMLLGLIWGTVREARNSNSVVVHGHWWIPGGFVAVVASFISQCRSVVHLHGSDSAIAGGWFMRRFARWVLNRATVCLAVSDNLAKWGNDLSSREVLVCPMPIFLGSSGLFQAPPIDGPILGVGRLEPEKGFDLLIEAVSNLPLRDRPPVVILGEGTERQALTQQAISCGVRLSLPGSVPPIEVEDWYHRARFVVVPSRREGFGLVAAEAAACGRAVIASNVGAMRSIIKHGESGLLVEPGDAQELCEALKTINPSWGIKGPKQVESMKLENHGEWLSNFYESLT